LAALLLIIVYGFFKARLKKKRKSINGVYEERITNQFTLVMSKKRGNEIVL